MHHHNVPCHDTTHSFPYPLIPPLHSSPLGARTDVFEAVYDPSVLLARQHRQVVGLALAPARRCGDGVAVVVFEAALPERPVLPNLVVLEPPLQVLLGKGTARRPAVQQLGQPEERAHIHEVAAVVRLADRGSDQCGEDLERRPAHLKLGALAAAVQAHREETQVPGTLQQRYRLQLVLIRRRRMVQQREDEVAKEGLLSHS